MGASHGLPDLRPGGSVARPLYAEGGGDIPFQEKMGRRAGELSSLRAAVPWHQKLSRRNRDKSGSPFSVRL